MHGSWTQLLGLPGKWVPISKAEQRTMAEPFCSAEARTGFEEPLRAFGSLLIGILGGLLECEQRCESGSCALWEYL